MTQFMETRLFPRKQGADAVQIRGLAARCDLVIVSDRAEPHIHLVGDPVTARTVFISLRHPVPALEAFLDAVLPRLSGPFIVISGSADPTFPDQCDTRFPAYPAELTARLEGALTHSGLVHWYAENLSLPLGLVFETDDARASFAVDQGPDISDRALKVLCAHRERDGAQWAPRRAVSALARGPWSEFCTVPDGELDPTAFDGALHAHAFVACVEGGGFDPSPKAWLALTRGAIPIIKRGTLSPAYDLLPCVQVEAWEEDALTLEKLKSWREALAPQVRDPSLLEQLSLDEWWQRIERGTPIKA